MSAFCCRIISKVFLIAVFSSILYAGEIFQNNLEDADPSVLGIKSIEVRGGVIHKNDKSYYELSAVCETIAEEAKYDAILFYAEPSHTLIFANINPNVKNKDETVAYIADELPLVTSESEILKAHTLSEYKPNKDTTLLVTVLNDDQQSVLSNAHVNLSSFGFSIEFRDEESNGSTRHSCPPSAPIHVTCFLQGSGTPCVEKHVCCKTFEYGCNGTPCCEAYCGPLHLCDE